MEEVDTVLEKFGTEIEKKEELAQHVSTPKKTLRFTEESSILKELSVSKRKPIGLTQPYFRPRSNLKPKKRNVSHYGVYNISPAINSHLHPKCIRIRRNRNKIIDSLGINLENTFFHKPAYSHPFMEPKD